MSGLNKKKPGFLIYQEIYATESTVYDKITGEAIGTKTKHYMKNPTVVDNFSWLQSLCSPALLSYSAALTMSDLATLKEKSMADYYIAKKNFESAKSGKQQRMVQTFYGKDRWPIGLIYKD
jgi:hypothetical protein